MDCTLASAEVRTERRKIKERITAGRVPVGRVVMQHDPLVEGMRVSDIVRALRGVDRIRMNAICRKAGVLPTERLCELTMAERRRLVLALPVRVAGR